MQNQKANRTAQTPAAMSTHVKETYVKPEAEIVKLELEQPILSGSGDEGSRTGRNPLNGGKF